MLFKVMEHPEMYRDEFTKWCSENIEAALVGFADSSRKAQEESGEAEDDK